MIFLSKKLRCQRGESDFPWLTVLIGIPILISFFGGDDENDNKAVDTSEKEKTVLEEKARKTKANDLIDTAKKEFEKAKEIAKEKIADAKDEYNKAKKQVKVKNNFSEDVFSDTDDKFKLDDDELFK